MKPICMQSRCRLRPKCATANAPLQEGQRFECYIPESGWEELTLAEDLFIANEITYYDKCEDRKAIYARLK